MKWTDLYSARRTGDARDKQINPDSVRNASQRDYDRIIFSSAFRRLQNKTQVFPLPGAVFVHNRLTHSLEVASVGRSLSKAVGDKIAAKYKDNGEDFTEFYKYELPSVIAAACLAHDIGNPPFGHSGEYAIRSFFTGLNDEQKEVIHGAMTAEQVKDFELFEGNSNALRILTKDNGGEYNLTYTTLASIVKYPSSSATGFKKTGLIATKKSGFFSSELSEYTAIANALGIPQKDGYEHVYARHPFVYLTEAADDICYRIVDMEDAHRLGIVSIDKIKELFLPFFENSPTYLNRQYVEGKMDAIPDANRKIGYLRAVWIGLMTGKLADAFLEHEELLLAGNLEKDLLKCLPEHECKLIDAINEYSYKYIYNYKSVVEIEIAGYTVIGGLLKEFIHAVLNPKDTKSQKMLQLVSSQFPITRKPEHLYSDIQSIVDFISGMTDLYAIDMYRKITGITIPEIR